MTEYRNAPFRWVDRSYLAHGDIENSLIGYETGKENLERLLQIARQKEMHDYAACCYINLVSFCIQSRLYPEAQRWLEEGLEYTITGDQPAQNTTVILLLALITLGQLKVQQDDGDEPGNPSILTAFQQLSAKSAAAVLRKKPYVQGIKGVSCSQSSAIQSPVVHLTPRELEVLQLIADGLSNPAIAERLTISVGTVKAHTASIYRKLGIKNRVQALSRAQELHLLIGE